MPAPFLPTAPSPPASASLPHHPHLRHSAMAHHPHLPGPASLPHHPHLRHSAMAHHPHLPPYRTIPTCVTLPWPSRPRHGRPKPPVPRPEAQLKNHETSSDGQPAKAHRASADTPRGPGTEYALRACQGHTPSCGDGAVSCDDDAPGWDLPPPRTFPYDHFRGYDDWPSYLRPTIHKGRGGGVSSYVKILDPLRDQEGGLA